MDLDHGSDDVQVSLEELLNRVHGGELSAEEQVHHAGFHEVIQMMPQGYLPEAALVCYFKKNTAPVACAYVAVVVFRLGGGELRLVDNLEVDVQVSEVLLQPGPVGLVYGVVDPVDHDAVELVGDRKPPAADGQGHGQCQRILASGDAQKDVLAIADHVEVVDAFAHIFDETHDPGHHIPLDYVGI